MFTHKQFGEVDDDTYYLGSLWSQELAYSNLMIGQPIPDYEKERWLAGSSQLAGMIGDIGIENVGYSDSPVLMAGFDLSSNWPIMAILGIGMVVAMRKGKPGTSRRRRRSRRR